MIHVSRMTVPHAQRALAIRRARDAAKNVFFCVHTGQLLRLLLGYTPALSSRSPWARQIHSVSALLGEMNMPIRTFTIKRVA
jgi:hypothetical protein